MPGSLGAGRDSDPRPSGSKNPRKAQKYAGSRLWPRSGRERHRAASVTAPAGPWAALEDTGPERVRRPLPVHREALPAFRYRAVTSTSLQALLGFSHAWGRRFDRSSSSERPAPDGALRKSSPCPRPKRRADAAPHPNATARTTPRTPTRSRYVLDLFDDRAALQHRREALGNGGLSTGGLSFRFAGLWPGMRCSTSRSGLRWWRAGSAPESGRRHVFGVDPSMGMMREARKVFVGPLTRGMAQTLPFRTRAELTSSRWDRASPRRDLVGCSRSTTGAPAAGGLDPRGPLPKSSALGHG